MDTENSDLSSGQEVQRRLQELSPAKRKLLQEQIARTTRRTDPPIGKRLNPGDDAPLSLGQRGLWVLDCLDTELTAYNIFRTWRIVGALDIEALSHAVDSLVARHESLRTTIQVIDGEPCQIISPPQFHVLKTEDVRSSSEGQFERVCCDQVTREIEMPMNLATGPLFRARLYCLGDGEHVLLLVMHHAVSDGWSMSVLIRDLSVFFNACVMHQPPNLPSLPLTYADYAYWQRHIISTLRRKDIDYWKETLADAPRLLDLPLDKKRPAVQSYRGHRHSFMINAEQTSGLRALATDRGATLFMVLLTIFKIILYRFSGQTDLCVGTPFANRSTLSVENLVGMFVNTLVIRTQFNENPNFAEALDRVRHSALGAFCHASTHTGQILEALRVPRDLSYNPLFQVMFILQNTPGSQLTLNNLDIDYYVAGSTGVGSQGNGTAKFDMCVVFREYEGGLIGTMENSSELFDDSTTRSLCECFQNLLNSIVENPNQSISTIPLLGPEARHRIRKIWNSTDRGPGLKETIQSRFSAQVANTPDAVALSCENRSVRYEELAQYCSRIANWLVDNGVAPGSTVAVAMPAGIERIATILAILEAHAVFVPLDVTYPMHRLSAMISEAEVKVVVTLSQTEQKLSKTGATVLTLIDHDDRFPASSSQAESEFHNIPSAAYLMFTSGSSGRPKGVIGTHRGLLNRIDWMQRTFPYSDTEHCCHRTDLGFVDAIAEVFGPLLAGTPARIFTDEERADPISLIDNLQRYGITRISLTPVLLRAMLDSIKGITSLDRLNLWVSSGEELSSQLWKRFHDQLPSAILLNLYGCTEVAADALWFDCRSAEPGRRIPIGRPIDNMAAYVLDDNDQPQPVGFSGELCISGVGVADGYWRQDELTAKNFVKNPFSSNEEKLYRSNDVARCLANGHFEYLNRRDSQVKIHGIRIETLEIESALTNHAGINESAVALWEDLQSRSHLVAWYVCGNEKTISPVQLRRFLGRSLPRQWLPSYFIELKELPLLPSGKIDRRSLPAPSTARPALETKITTAGNAIEKRLVWIWRLLLNLDAVGIHDNFFDLGGNSIQAFELLAKIEKAFKIRFQLSTIFLAPTISDLAAHIQELSTVPGVSNILYKIRDRGGKSPFYCVPAAATSALSLLDIPANFSKSQSFIGIQPLGFDRHTRAQSSIVDMAANYIEAIKQNQPTGPYYLGGRCFGGVVALEMGQQFVANGDEIGLLVLLDTALPVSNPFAILKSLNWEKKMRFILRSLPDRLLASATRKTIAREFNKSLLQMPDMMRRPIRLLDDAHRAALRAYVPRPIEAPLVIIRSTMASSPYRTGWKLIAAQGYQCVDVPGDHFSMFEPPNISILSSRLSTLLASAGAS